MFLPVYGSTVLPKKALLTGEAAAAAVAGVRGGGHGLAGRQGSADRYRYRGGQPDDDLPTETSLSSDLAHTSAPFMNRFQPEL